MNLCIYIAGPVTGIPNFNRDGFAAGERYARSMWPAARIINPIAIGGLQEPRAAYMRHAFHNVLQADRLLLLPGWERSDGALLEKRMADELNLPTLVVGSEELAPYFEK